MRYQITHQTTYQYSQPVELGRHILRLRPRTDGTQWLTQFDCAIAPTPLKTSEITDFEGNACQCVWFTDAATSQLHIQTTSVVETGRHNAFDYLSEPWAMNAPIDYPSSLAGQLAPYLSPATAIALSPQIVEFAHTILQEVEGHVGMFLTQLTRQINQDLQYLHRPFGSPQLAIATLAQRSGSCRDFTVLFMLACQAVGLAARFVSGYQEGDLAEGNHELHAWPEVYIPGGGWRGFDPTLGLAVADRHVALAAALYPINAAPVSGTLKTQDMVKSTLQYDVKITTVE
ncbi:MAG: transglutaminase family protein [Cyanobacteria bacterium J06638_20]